MINPSRKTIEEILRTTESTYSVPAYQRSFDWGKNELQELVDDLKEAHGIDDLFLGNFIFDNSEKNNIKIVDGQQRLTTISIVLIAIREHAKAIGEAEFAGELQNLISVNASWSEERGCKVKVSENIRDLFDHISDIDWDGKFPEKLNGKSIKRQINKVKPIYSYVLDEFSKYNLENLKDFTRSLLHSYVIVIGVQDTDDVFSIFERTNARGLDLKIGDLLKNYIFAHQEEEYEERWMEIINNAESSLQRMLKYFWVSREGHIQSSMLFKSLKGYGNEVGIEQFVNELYTFSRYYKTVQSQDPEVVREWLEENELDSLSKNEDNYKKITRVFQALKLFRVTQAYPLIFSIFFRYQNSDKRSYKNLIRVLENIENFHFVNNVISGRIGNEVEKLYANQSEVFYKNDGDFSLMVEDFLKELKKKKAQKEEFMSNFSVNVTYDDISLVNYVFDRINNHGATGAQRVEIFAPEKNLKKRDYNIEHILPQNYKREYENIEDLENFDRVGNLLVISRHTNSLLQDKDPQEKIKVLKSDPKHAANLRYLKEFMEEYESQMENWDFIAIQKRSEDLAKRGFEEIWNF